MRSDLLFNLGYALLWVGLFAVVKEGLWRALVVGLLHAVTILLALIATGAHRFYEVTEAGGVCRVVGLGDSVGVQLGHLPARALKKVHVAPAAEEREPKFGEDPSTHWSE